MDRLGRNAIDVKSTIDRLTGMLVRIHCLQLGGADLTSAAGKMIMGMLNTFAEFERDLLIERTQSGMARAKAAGKQLGRQPVLTLSMPVEISPLVPVENSPFRYVASLC